MPKVKKARNTSRGASVLKTLDCDRFPPDWMRRMTDRTSSSGGNTPSYQLPGDFLDETEMSIGCALRCVLPCSSRPREGLVEMKSEYSDTALYR